MRSVSLAGAGIAGLSLILAGALSSATNANPPAAAPIVVVPGAENYTAAPSPFPNGVMIAVLSGNPSEAGRPYTIRIKLPDGARVPVHTHGDTENVTVIQGTFLVAIGDTFDASKLKALPAGAYVSIPPNLAHYAMAKGPTIVDVSGLGPESTNFLK
jgi:quercetin dioxygenase-like cupin family protein